MLGGDRAESVRRIHESPIRSHLIDALDAWMDNEMEDGVRARVTGIVSEATGQPWRKQQALLRSMPSAASAFARLIPPDQLTPSLAASLGMLLYAAGKDGAAVMRACLTRHPSDFWLHLYLGTVSYAVPGQAAVTVAHFQAAAAIRPDVAEVWLWLAAGLAGRGDLDASEAALRKARQLDPKLVADFAKGIQGPLFNDISPDDILEVGRKVIRLNPKGADGYSFLALGKLRKGDLAGAEEASRQAMRLDSRRFGGSHREVGRAWEAKGNKEAALRCYREADEASASNARDRITKGNELRDQGSLDEAIACFADAVSLDPGNLGGRNALGAALFARGNSTRALEAFQEVTRREPTPANAVDIAHAWDWVAFIHLANGDAKAALPAAREAVRLGPASSQARYDLGRALAATGDYDEAITQLTEARRLDPKNPTRQAALEEALRKKAAREGRLAPPPREVKRP